MKNTRTKLIDKGTKSKMKNIICTLPLALVFLLSGCSGEQKTASEILLSDDGYAIHGYDPVAYFSKGTPQKGMLKYSADWNNAKWLFSSKDNRDKFLAAPKDYAPQYGGWCAYGMAEGYAAETDPVNAWTIHEGKLYLNWDAEVSREWSQDIKAYLQKSESNWPTVQNQLAAGEATVYWHEK